MKQSLSILIPAMLLLASCGGSQPQQATTADIAIKDAYEGCFKIGAAISNRDFSERNPETKAILLKHFNAISPDNDLKPESLHPSPDVWNWERADNYIKFGQENGMWMLGHTLCWHNQTPDFFWNKPNGQPKSKQELFDTIEDYIKTVVTHFNGKVNAWDVINEIVAEDGGYRDLGWVHALGADPAVVDEFIKHVYRCANKYATPETELYYNEFNVWRPSKLEGVMHIVKMLREEGLRIDGVGIQAHWGLNYPKNEYIEQAIDKLAALGVKVMITEIDVDVLPLSKEGQVFGRSLHDPLYQAEEFEVFLDPYKEGLPAEVEQQLADRYEELFKIFYAKRDKIDRVTFWGVNDGTSWKNGSPIPRRTNYPLPFTRDNQPHQAYYSIVNVPAGK